MKKKKVLLLLGAGSSVEQGLPSVGQLNERLKKWAQDYADIPRPNFRIPAESQKQPDFFNLLWENRAEYIADIGAEGKAVAEHRTAPNYERVLGDLHALMNGVLGKPFGDPLLRWIAKAEVFASRGIAKDDAGQDDSNSHDFHAVQGQLQFLSRRLAESLRGHSDVFELELKNGRGVAPFNRYQHLLHGLAEAFDLGVYSLNYDTVALNALPKVFVGFDRRNGEFLPASVLGRREWGFLYHLHGSVHHRLIDGSNVIESQDFGSKITWYEDLNQTGDRIDWQDAGHLTTQSDGKRVLLTTLVAGGWKLDQLQEEPYQTFYSCLPRHIQQADAILIAGYGFGDSHINSVFANVLRAKANGGGGRPPVLVVDFGLRTHRRLSDGWGQAVERTLRASAATFREPQHRKQPHWTALPERVTDSEFEQALDHKNPVAVWNHGFLAAEAKLPQIVSWLSGDRDALG